MSLHLKRHHPTHYQEVQVVSDDDDSTQPHCSKDTSKPTYWQSRITDAFNLTVKIILDIKPVKRHWQNLYA